MSGDRLHHAHEWLKDRWCEEHPNEGHVKMLAEYAAALSHVQAPAEVVQIPNIDTKLSQETIEALKAVDLHIYPFASPTPQIDEAMVAALLVDNDYATTDLDSYDYLIKRGHTVERLYRNSNTVDDAMVERAARALAALELGMGDAPGVIASVVNARWKEFVGTARAALQAAIGGQPVDSGDNPHG